MKLCACAAECHSAHRLSTRLTVPSSVSEPGYCPVRLGMTTGRLQSGVNTLQGFKEDKRNRVAPGERPLGQSPVMALFAPWLVFCNFN